MRCIEVPVCAQVAIDNIDADLFGRGVRGGFFQPSDAMLHKIRNAMYDILREAYAEDLVRSKPEPYTLSQLCPGGAFLC